MINWPLAVDTWNAAERTAMHRIIDSGMFTMGNNVEEFQARFCEIFGVKYAVMVNSGSSANLLMAAACLELNYFKEGSEIIVPAVGWSTSYFPFHQAGLEVVFVDVDDTWNIDVNRVEAAITSKTRAVLGINLLGNPCTFDQLIDVCNKHDLTLLEDNCESLGSGYDNKFTGSFGTMGTYSTFFSHHIQTMEGGLIACNDSKTFNTLKSLRSHGWTRNTIWESDNPFTFKTIGYNVRPGELHAAVGLAQLDKWDGMDETRSRNAYEFIANFEDKSWCTIQRVSNLASPSWFGFGLVFSEPGMKERAQELLTANNVEHRPIVCGNFVNQPVFKKMRARVHGDTPVADKIDSDGIFLGNNPIDLVPQIRLTAQLLEKHL
tara:strand:+ start:14878 stop:16008 length:1131 start_codon:yes stop_codon:yes gene_type:complete